MSKTEDNTRDTSNRTKVVRKRHDVKLMKQALAIVSHTLCGDQKRGEEIHFNKNYIYRMFNSFNALEGVTEPRKGGTYGRHRLVFTPRQLKALSAMVEKISEGLVTMRSEEGGTFYVTRH